MMKFIAKSSSLLLTLVSIIVAITAQSSSTGVANRDSIVPSSHTNCISYSDSQGAYSAQACPIITGTQVAYPVSLSGETILNFPTRDDSFISASMPFSVNIYGIAYSSVSVATNGYLMFGSNPVSDYNNPIPYDGYNGAGPILEPLQADLFLLTGSPIQSDVSTGTVGSSPNRLFVIRFARAVYWSSQSNILNFDVVFYENSTSTIQYRYYRIDTTSTAGTSIGLQGVDSTRYMAIYSSESSVSSISTALQGNTLTFTWLNPNTSAIVRQPLPIDPIVPSSHTNCIPFTDSLGYYSVQACPMVTGTSVVSPVTLPDETMVPYPSSNRDDNYVNVAMPFSIGLYGRAYSTVAVVTNGNLQFGNTPTASGTYGQPIPSAAYTGNVGPAIEPYQADLYLLSASSTTQQTNVSTGTVGSSPNRLFVVRYNKIGYFASASRNNLMTFDVVFYENSTSTIQIRYYRIDPTANIGTSIGLQANDTARFVAVYSSQSNVSMISQALQGNALTFTFINTPIAQPSSTGGSGPANSGAIVPSSHTNCISYSDSQGAYSAQACPIITGTQVAYPVSLSGETILNFPTRDDSFISASMPFSVNIYGIAYSSVSVATNGYLMFGSNPVSDYNNPIPYDGYNGAGPILEPLQADLFLLTGSPIQSDVSTGTVGSSPNRLFVIRFARAVYWSSQSNILNFDVVFYENSTSTIQYRYYRIDTTSTAGTSIGLQGVDSTRYMAIYSSESSVSSISTALQGNTLTFTWLNPNTSAIVRQPLPIDPIVPSSHTNCIPFTDSLGYYSVQACPMVTGTSVVSPVTLPDETMVPYPSSNRDDNYVNVAMPFSIGLYGRAYSTVAVVTNGNLQFGNTPTASGTYGQPIPSAAYTGNVGPAIEPYQADLYLLSASSTTQQTNVSTGTVGSSPNRLFVVRYNKIGYFASASRNNLMTFDVVFYENSTSTIQIRYYRIDPTANIGTSIGLQANDTARFVAVYSSQSNVSMISQALQGNALTFNWLLAPVPMSSSTGVARPSSTAGAFSSAVSSSAGAASSAGRSSSAGQSSSAGGQTPSPSSSSSAAGQPPVTPSTSSVRPSSSSSSAPNSATSNFATSSLAAPGNAATIVFNAEVPSWVNSNTLPTFQAAFAADIAANLQAEVSGVAATLVNYIRVQSVGGVPAARRLLQSSKPVTVLILGTVTEISQNANSLAQALATRIRDGRFVGTTAAVPAQNAVVNGAVPGDSSSSSSSSLSGGAIAGIVIGVIVGVLILLLVIFFLCVSSRRGKAGRASDDDSRFVSEGSEHSQMPIGETHTEYDDHHQQEIHNGSTSDEVEMV